MDFWSYQVLNNTLKDFAAAAAAFAVLAIVFRVFQNLILRRLSKLAERTRTVADDTFIDIVQSIKPPFYLFVAFYLALYFLNVEETFQKIINIVLIIWVVYQVTVAVQVLINDLIQKRFKGETRPAQSALKSFGFISKFILWSVGVLFTLSNLGVNITSLVAGLGIGGVAAALAIQNILSDLFSSFAIYLDKPFVEGDFIVVGPHMGTVEKIGIKTTRLRALQGEEIIISNKELTSTRIQNFKRMKERRVIFNFGVVYETPQKKLKAVPAIVKSVIAAVKAARFDRAHFNKFDDSALSFEVVYYVQTGDYNQYMDIHQEILFRIKEEFEKNKIVMAYPTRTVYLHSAND